MNALSESDLKKNPKAFKTERLEAARAPPVGANYLSDQCAVCAEKPTNESYSTTYATTDCELTPYTIKYLLPEYRRRAARVNEVCRARNGLHILGKPRGCPNCCSCPPCQRRAIMYAAMTSEARIGGHDGNEDFDGGNNNEEDGYLSDGSYGNAVGMEAGLDGSGGVERSPKRLREVSGSTSCVQGKCYFLASRKN